MKTKLTNSQRVTIIAALIGGTCVVVAAFVGLGVPVVEKLLQSSPSPTSISPSPTPIIATTTPQVIYKSPAEMNLRPGDISSLTPTVVQNPSQSLLPDITDQDQRAFTNGNQNNYIETDVMVGSAGNSQTPSDIYNLVVPKRRPSATKASNNQPVNIGEQGSIFAITDQCGSGYVLIFKRSNVIVLIIGCGQNINESLIKEIGQTIDGHITISHEAECTQLDLTPEECANLGTYQYQATVTRSTLIPSKYVDCSPGTTQGLITETIIFSENGDILVFTNFADFINGSTIYNKSGINVFSSSFQAGLSDNISSTITFDENGLVQESTDKIFVENAPSASCFDHAVFTLIK